MITGIRINKGKELTKSKKLVFYNKPKKVYIPLISGGDRNVTVIVKKGDYIHKGSIVAKRKGKYKIPIYSSVSGTVIDFEEKYCNDGDLVKCVVIENDFKERIERNHFVRERINDYTKKEFISILQDCGIVGEGGAGFPTYAKYNTDMEIKTLIVNALESEPYITNDSALLKEKVEEILETMDAIMDINGIKEGFIALSKNSKLIKKINNYIGTYPRIKIVLIPEFYPMGWERYLVKLIKNTTYNQLPLEQGIVVNNLSTIYSIYEALKYNKPLIEKIVTFTGEMLKQPKNIHLKIGTSVKDVIESIDGYKRNKDVVMVAGGPMMGKCVPSDDLVITPEMNCVLVLKHNHNEEILDCIKCGKCIEMCPNKLSPVIIKENLKNIEELRKLKADRCVECGLCSYICPSKINLRLLVKNAKEKIKEEGK